MNRDLMIRELSDETGHEAFVIIGEPDIKIIDYPNNQIAVEVRGYDTFDPATGNASEGGPDDVACWMIDTDHNGESFFATAHPLPRSRRRQADQETHRRHRQKRRRRGTGSAHSDAISAVRSAREGADSRQDRHRYGYGNDFCQRNRLGETADDRS